MTSVLEAVDGALKLSAPFLAGNPWRLPGQLTGRLAGHAEPGIADMLETVRSGAPGSWLCPLTPALTASGGPLDRVLVGHAHSVWSLAFTPDGSHIVSGSLDCTIRIWDVATGRLERTLPGEVMVNAVAVTPDGRWIVSGGQDGKVGVWDFATGHRERVLEGHTSRVAVVAATPDSRWIVSGSEDRTLRVWDLASGKLLHVLEGHVGEIVQAAITPDGRRLRWWLE